ncbi:protein FAR1-RELATED SEQUENCE 5-like [Salvia splendens]|uniref:protein FAR1-RELATED SEQUENCE 5-like n=1 Tax=Salvia splendens TaxID=180675 RepID=UPI001C259AFA|nr:protein FAR1-RELATED SEQUENCE 5-like [Salvia splendens]
MTLDRALDFYNNYARYVGFDTRKKGSKKEKDVITWIYVVCSREGTKQRKSEQSEVKRKCSSIKCYCNAKVSWKYFMGVGYVIQSFVEEHNHEMVEERHKHFMYLNRNLDLVHQKFILDCANANIGLTLSFSSLKEVLGGSDYVGCTVLEVRNYRRDLRAYVEGADAQLYCMIFAPFTCKDKHGRRVTFAAGLLSKENANSFSWLFNQFVRCMSVAPKLIVTDQDLGMKVVVEEVLVNTRHRWCMWHVMNKVADKLPKNMLELIEPDAFEETWHAIMERYGLANNDWFSSMFASRKFWVPAFFRDFPMSLLIKTTSLFESQNSFFKSHIFSVLKYNFVKLIPEKLRGERWLKSQFVKPIHGGFCDDQEIHPSVDKKKIAFKNVYALFVETTQSIEGNIDQINAFAAVIEEVHTPDVVSTKGSGSRKKSRRESAMKLAMKPGRKCGNCQEIGHHDSRNCKKVNEKVNQRQ